MRAVASKNAKDRAGNLALNIHTRARARAHTHTHITYAQSSFPFHITMSYLQIRTPEPAQRRDRKTPFKGHWAHETRRIEV